MDPFQQHVGRHQDLLTAEIHHRTIVSDTFLRGRLHGFQILGEVLNQTELTILRYFRSSHNMPNLAYKDTNNILDLKIEN